MTCGPAGEERAFSDRAMRHAQSARPVKHNSKNAAIETRIAANIFLIFFIAAMLFSFLQSQLIHVSKDARRNP
jgi:hypothetical protein